MIEDAACTSYYLYNYVTCTDWVTDSVVKPTTKKNEYAEEVLLKSGKECKICI